MATENSHNEWWTPRDLFAALNEEFYFGLDAAASHENACLPTYITAEQDALITPWRAEAVFCNPPYSQIGPFISRGRQQSEEQHNTVVMLIPAYTDPRYWSDEVMKAHEVRFLKGRLAFLDNGRKQTSARFPSVVVVFKWIKGVTYGKGPNQFVWDWRAAGV